MVDLRILHEYGCRNHDEVAQPSVSDG